MFNLEIYENYVIIILFQLMYSQGYWHYLVLQDSCQLHLPVWQFASTYLYRAICVAVHCLPILCTLSYLNDIGIHVYKVDKSF